MHELSIAMSIVDVVTTHLQQQGDGRVVAVRVSVGELSGVVSGALLSAWELAVEGSRLEGARLDVRDIPVEVNCPHCQAVRPIVSIQCMRCAVCNTLCLDVVHGRELDVTAMELADETAAAT